MVKRIEGTYLGFLQLITGKKARQLGDGTWEMTGAEIVREAAGTQSARIYIEQRQATVAQWVALHPLCELCEGDTGCEGGGRRSKVWWSQEATEKQLWITLAESREAKGKRRIGWEMFTQ